MEPNKTAIDTRPSVDERERSLLQISRRSVLVCFALKEEAAPFRRLKARHPNIGVLITGMGPRNAERSIKAALSLQRPDLVVTAGFAGGLRPEWPAGTVLFAADPEAALGPALLAAGARCARFHCSNRVAITAAEKRALGARTGADAVEMESHFIRGLCREAGIPSATVRVILDTVEQDLPLDFNDLMTKDDRLDGWKFAWALVKSPQKVGVLKRFQRQTQAVANRLAQVLDSALVGPAPVKCAAYGTVV